MRLDEVSVSTGLLHDVVEDTLVDLEKLKRANTPGLAAMPAEKINFSRGNLLFWYRDYDAAVEELRKAAAKVDDLEPRPGVPRRRRRQNDRQGRRNTMQQSCEIERGRSAWLVAYEGRIEPRARRTAGFGSLG